MHILNIVAKYLDIAGPLLGIMLNTHVLFRKQKAGGSIAIFSYLALQFIANSIAKYMAINQINNIKIYQVNAFLSLAIISMWFYYELKKNLSSRQLKWLRLYAVCSLFCSIFFISFEDTNNLNSLSLSFTAFNACLYCVIFYFSSLFNVNENDLLSSSAFWRVSAFFLYYCTCFFIYVTFKVFSQKESSEFMILWSIQNTILFVTCVILGISHRVSTKSY